MLPVNFPTGNVARERIRVLNVSGPVGKGPVMYWMSRDQRADDNWALAWTEELAQLNDAQVKPWFVVFNLVDFYLNAPVRHYHFMMRGLQKLSMKLKTVNVPFILTVGDPTKTIPQLVQLLGVS